MKKSGWVAHNSNISASEHHGSYSICCYAIMLSFITGCQLDILQRRFGRKSRHPWHQKFALSCHIYSSMPISRQLSTSLRPASRIIAPYQKFNVRLYHLPLWALLFSNATIFSVWVLIKTFPTILFGFGCSRIYLIILLVSRNPGAANFPFTEATIAMSESSLI